MRQRYDISEVITSEKGFLQTISSHKQINRGKVLEGINKKCCFLNILLRISYFCWPRVYHLPSLKIY